MRARYSLVSIGGALGIPERRGHRVCKSKKLTAQVPLLLYGTNLVVVEGVGLLGKVLPDQQTRPRLPTSRFTAYPRPDYVLRVGS